MTITGAFNRLAAMDGDELRFRVKCEARKIAGRIRHAVRPAPFDRTPLARVLDPRTGPLVATAVDEARGGNYLAAHRALASHFAARSSRWPLQGARRRPFVEELLQAFPDAAREARRQADRTLAGRQDFLGYRNVQLSSPPDWHADVIHGRRADHTHWTQMRYLDPAIGDHKVIWEINRHQYWLPLGVAYWLTGDRIYRDTVIAHLEDWVVQNPPGEGINWTSMLELGFRALSWTWAVEFFAADGVDDETPWLVDLLVSLDAQLTHVSHNLSRYFSPNTHLTGEALALYAVSAAFPELRRSAERQVEGRGVLIAEASRQIHPDGGHAELSAHYHRYTTDFYLLALMVARAGGDTAAATFEDVLRRTAIYMRTITDDRGILPLIGDDDGGQLFRFGTRSSADASASLNAAASLLRDASLAVSAPTDEVHWILGRRPDDFAGRTPWPSRALRDSGYFVSRNADGQMIFDAGRHGYLNGGHAHADALSVILHVAGEPVLVDPGTATYTMNAAARDRMRSARMHNTVVVDGREHALPSGPFHWQSRTDARMLVGRVGPEIDFVVGVHDGYRPFRHFRAVLTLGSIGWIIVDRVTGHGSLAADAWWHFHPAWQATVQDGAILLRNAAGRRVGIATTAGDVSIVNDNELSVYAPEYGRVESATTVRASHAGEAPVIIGTFVAASAAGTAPLAILTSPPRVEREWVMCPFAVRTGSREIRVEVPFPADPAAEPAAPIWPQPCIEQLAQSCVE